MCASRCHMACAQSYIANSLRNETFDTLFECLFLLNWVCCGIWHDVYQQHYVTVLSGGWLAARK